MKQHAFLILGNDERQKYLYKILKKHGYRVRLSEEFIKGCFDVVLLPITDATKYFEDLKNNSNGIRYIFGCKISELASDIIKRNNDSINLIEYMKSDYIAYKNALATAEGAVAEAIKLSPLVLQGEKALVCGYGKCGEVLALKLKALGADVYIVEEMHEKLGKAYACGFKSVKLGQLKNNQQQCKEFNYIFNTVESMIIDDRFIDNLSQNVCIIDIASKLGGVDYDYCRKKGVRAIHALGLPGKYAPYSSAMILYEVIDYNL